MGPENPAPPLLEPDFSDTAACRGSQGIDFSAGTASLYPAGAGNTAILPTIAPNSPRIIWLSASSTSSTGRA